MSKLLQEAIADAHKVKEIAYENAKAAIEEAFQPKIQRMISSKLAEEEYEEEMPPTPEEEEFPPIEDEFMDEETYVDDGRDGTPADNLKDLDEEFDKIIRELEGDDMDDDMDDFDDEMPMERKGISEKDDPYKKNVSKTKKNMTEMDDMSDDEDLENLELESLIKHLVDEELSAMPATSGGSREVARLKSEISRLKAENRDAYKAVAKLKEAINEVSLLNSKLQFSSKVIRNFDLTEAQQIKVLETFDRANSIREVKLIYSTIQESYKGKSQKPPVRRKPTVMKESASRTIQTVKGKSASNSRLMEGAERWQIIAGLKPLND